MKNLFRAIMISVLFPMIGFAGSLTFDFPEGEPLSENIQDQLRSFILPSLESEENQLQPLIAVGLLGKAFEECPSTVAKIVKEKNIDIKLDSARQNCASMFKKLGDFHASQGIKEDREDDECCVIAIEELLKAYSDDLWIKAEEAFKAYERGDYSSRKFEFRISENLAGSNVCPKGEICL